MILWSSCFASHGKISRSSGTPVGCTGSPRHARESYAGVPKDGPAILEPHAGGETRKVMEDLSSLLSPGATISLYIIYCNLSFFNYTTAGLTSKTWSF